MTRDAFLGDLYVFYSQEAGMFLHNRQMVETQVYKKQIWLGTGERADYGNDSSSSPSLHFTLLFLSLPEWRPAFPLSYSLITTFTCSFNYQKEN